VLFGSIQQAFYGGQSPWQYEALYVNRAMMATGSTGTALSREMAELKYTVTYYYHVNTAADALKVVQHLPYDGHGLKADRINYYAWAVVEQAINQLIQVTPLEQVNEKMHDLTALVYTHLQEFLAAYGISLINVKVVAQPSDARMKALISLKAFGLSEIEAVRYYTAMLMAERGIVSAPNMAVGEPFAIGGVTPTFSTEGIAGVAAAPGAVLAPAPGPQ
jgi:hypothetical protein